MFVVEFGCVSHRYSQGTEELAIGPVRHEGVRKLNNVKDVVNQVVELVADNAKKMAVLGARTMVLGKFHDAVLPHLTPLQRVEVIDHFDRALKMPCREWTMWRCPPNITRRCLT